LAKPKKGAPPEPPPPPPPAADAPTVEYDGKVHFEIPEAMPLLPIRDLVVFPYMIVPLLVSREISVEAVNQALSSSKERLVFLAAQKDIGEDDPTPETIFTTGTVGMIMRMRKLSDGRIKILVQGLVKAQVKKYTKKNPFVVEIDRLPDEEPRREDALEAEALLRSVKENLEKYAQGGKLISPELMLIMSGVEEPGRLADLVASNLGLKVSDAQQLLEMRDPVARLRRCGDLLQKEVDLLEVQARIQTRAKEEMSKTQREYYLREQLRAIRTELGDADQKAEEIEELRTRIARAQLPEEARAESEKQLRRLESMHPDAAEASVVRTYLDWVLELPWSVFTEDSADLKAARRILDEDHYDLETVKDRILEYLAVRKLRGGTHGPILCFLGPPGVGKTSLGRSIARALGRKFIRISLGGVRDEAEIRGHRRTYVGALPGRIIQGMKQAGAHNPVFMLDEIDKLGQDNFRGDPGAALLEVLDPEQNHTFRDHYLNLNFDLSRVLFIATANAIDPIPTPLRDRMEIIRLAGYAEEEKVHIARRYIIPKQIEENGLGIGFAQLGTPALRGIIAEYTREAGLRELERQIAQIFRKIARKVAEQGSAKPIKVLPKNLGRYLGPPKYPREAEREEVDEVGVATGLAWTPYGGEILQIEAQMMPGKGNLMMTGQLGEVMKESAQAALSFARARAAALGIANAGYADQQIHIHVPAGAVPKDGPSAGITMATTLVSLLTGIPVKRGIAMTGELTLRGRVLPVGGLKEKLLAAARSKIHTVVVPEGNWRELEEIPRHVRARVKLVPVRTMDEVLNVALAPGPKEIPAPPPPKTANA
jgi:ATP-dependent Lon protease